MAENIFATSNESIPLTKHKYKNPQHYPAQCTVQDFAIMHKSKQVHTTYSLLEVFLQRTLHQIGHLMDTHCAKNVVYCNKSWCSKAVVQTRLIWFLQVNLRPAQLYCCYMVYFIRYAHLQFSILIYGQVTKHIEE